MLGCVHLHITQLDFGVEEVPAHSEIPWHEHNDKEEIIFVFKGTGQAFVGEEEGPLYPGDI